MGKLEDTLAQAVKDGKIPHAVVYATNSDGSFTYSHAVGKYKIDDDKPIPEDAVFKLASQTKLLASISALQVVEKGLIGLDDDLANKVPELAAQPVVTGFDDKDEPILVKRKNTLTLRHLLTHSSGLAYDSGHPDLIKIRAKQGQPVQTGGTMEERFTYPLVFEPGTGWIYGSSIDWAGKVVEKVAGQTLEEHMKKNIFEPLGIETITFWPDEREDLKDRFPQLMFRTPEGGLVPHTEPIMAGAKECFGGHGASATLGDYLKILRSILANDGKILKPQTVEMMFTPQLTPESKQALKGFRNGPFAHMIIGENDGAIEADWGLGGILFLEDDQGRRKKGTLNWGGVCNTFWIIDREADLTLTFGTQVLPPGDQPTSETITAVEKAVYEMAGVKF